VFVFKLGVHTSRREESRLNDTQRFSDGMEISPGHEQILTPQFSEVSSSHVFFKWGVSGLSQLHGNRIPLFCPPEIDLVMVRSRSNVLLFFNHDKCYRGSI
jgi:hypothetical protein